MKHEEREIERECIAYARRGRQRAAAAEHQGQNKQENRINNKEMSNIEFEIKIEGKKVEENLCLEISKMMKQEFDTHLKNVVIHFCKWLEMNGVEVPKRIVSDYLTKML